MVGGSRPDSPLPVEPAGHLGRGVLHAVARRLPQQHQPPDELLARRWSPESRRLPPAADALHRGHGVRRARDAAKAYFNAPGWTAYHTQNPWFETAPSHLPATAGPTCGAWMATHIWDALPASPSTATSSARPTRCCAARPSSARPSSWRIRSKLAGHGPSSSPENLRVHRIRRQAADAPGCASGRPTTSRSSAASCEGTIAAARVLGTDAEFAAELEERAARLPPTRVNAEGRIMEWQEDFEEVEVPTATAPTCGACIPASKSARDARAVRGRAQVARPPRRCLHRLVDGVEGELLGAPARRRPRGPSC
jgi:hypothetical protein